MSLPVGAGRLVALFLMLGGIHAGALGFVLIAWFVDLWAKSFDFPRVQKLAMALLALVAASGMAGLSGLAMCAIQLVHGPVLVGTLAILVVPPFALVLWMLYDVDLRVVDVGALGGLVIAARSGATTTPPAVALAAGVGLALLALAFMSMVPGRRFRRYARSLQRDCSCCGLKQRAVHELAGMGVRGEATILAYLASPEGRRDNHVQDEWRRCRPA
jgi:hypothetical protein